MKSMRMVLWGCSVLMVLVLCCCRTESESGRAGLGTRDHEIADRTHNDFRLDNGLRVLLRPVKGTGDMALVVLFDIGNHHDPVGCSGMAHLIEHLYVTSATEKRKERLVSEIAGDYPAGWNAQTGDSYTVTASVFPSARLDEELEVEAAKMKALLITTEGLEREKARIVIELENMYRNIPELAAGNLAREQLCPSPHGGRKGGLDEDLERMGLAQVKERIDRYYKPINARLILAGNFMPAEAAKSIKRIWEGIPPGSLLPPASVPGPPLSTPRIVGSKQRDVAPRACVAYRAPRPGDDLYGAFLVLISRLHAQSSRLNAGRWPVSFAVLDDPSVVRITMPITADEDVDSVRARVQAFIAEELKPALSDDDIFRVKNQYGMLLGLIDFPDAVLAQNLYGTAFSLGRRAQMGLVPGDLAVDLEKLSDEQLASAIRAYFDPDGCALAAVIPE